MADIRGYIESHLLAPLKHYPTIIQNTMVEIIAEKLEQLYEYSWKFPSILTPDKNRLDILQAISDQFLFTVRNEADLQEQINILDNILYVYSRRGSIDTIENMWRYYGGDLPKDVKVIVPSYNLFRYSVSALSGTHTFAKGKSSSITLDTPAPEAIASGSLVHIEGTTRDIVTPGVGSGSYVVDLSNTSGLKVGDKVNVGGIYSATILSISSSAELDRTVNISGAYEIRLTNNTYPIPDLKEFLLKELVAAGNEIYFTNSVHMQVDHEEVNSNPPQYNVQYENFFHLQLGVMKSATQGLTLSGNRHQSLSTPGDLSSWSGGGSIFLESTLVTNLEKVLNNSYMTYEDLGVYVTFIRGIQDVIYRNKINKYYYKIIESFLYCTPEDNHLSIARYSYNSQGELIDSNYPKYFILGKTLLGTKIS